MCACIIGGFDILINSIALSTFVSATSIRVPAIASLWGICSSSSSPYPEISGIPVIGIPCCALSIFFASTVATPSGRVFMSVFFSFITALITTTMVESQRQGETPNAVMRYPAAPWLLVNIVSGAIVAPLVMAPGFFHHSRRCLRKQQQSRIASAGSLPNRAVHASAKLAIPLSVTGGFIIPSMILIFASSPTTVILWQFFPIYVAILFRLLRTILNQLPRTISTASQGRLKELLFTIPILLSILSYTSLIIYSFSLLFSQHHDEASHLTIAALHVLAINFLTIFITLIYWLYVEGGTSTTRAALKWTLVAGPGAAKRWLCDPAPARATCDPGRAEGSGTEHAHGAARGGFGAEPASLGMGERRPRLAADSTHARDSREQETTRALKPTCGADIDAESSGSNQTDDTEGVLRSARKPTLTARYQPCIRILSSRPKGSRT